MKIFSCKNCDNTTFFENNSCTHCDCQLGFDPASRDLITLTAAGDTLQQVDSKKKFKVCGNAKQFQACNWLIPAESADTLCTSCELTRTLPPMDDQANVIRVRHLEEAKRRLLFSLLTLQLPIANRQDHPDTGLCFDFKLDSAEPYINGEQPAVLTGHDQGVITINALEADPDEIERRKANLGEHYRSLLGHFRHEIGHYYWDVLIKDNPDRLARCRELFGDETLDYAEALKQHYGNPRQDWNVEFISSYASSHPWEDWAESWAHYLHIMDTVDTASEYELMVLNKVSGKQEDVGDDSVSFADIHEHWVTLSTALNSLNRSMGVNDPYPFVMPANAIAKLEFIHSVISEVGKTTTRKGWKSILGLGT